MRQIWRLVCTQLTYYPCFIYFNDTYIFVKQEPCGTRNPVYYLRSVVTDTTAYPAFDSIRCIDFTNPHPFAINIRRRRTAGWLYPLSR